MMNRNERKGIWVLYIVLTAVVASGITYYFLHDEKKTVLPGDTDEEQYDEFVDRNHPDSSAARPYYRGGGGGYASGNKRDSDSIRRSGGNGRPGSYAPYSSYGDQNHEPASFAFDPNTADSTALLALGLSPFQVRSIYKYRAKGGQYHRKEDFHRLYGLTLEQWQHLEPLIKIGEKYRYVSDLPKSSPHYVNDTVRRVVKYDEGQVIPINRCDTNALKKVPGIGDTYARRIVGYRNKLGGFVSVNQLSEVYDMPADVAKSLAKWFQVEPSLVHRMNVNQLSLNQLKKHPYINFYQAKVITEHRRLYGPLKSLDDLRLYDEFTAKDIERLRLYVCF